MILRSSHTDFYILRLGVGEGSNTRVELLALWGPLFFANKIHCVRLQVVGDLKLVVDWFNNNCNLQVMQWICGSRG